MGEAGPGAGTLDRPGLIPRHLATVLEAPIAEVTEAAGPAETTRSTAYRLGARLHAWGLVKPHKTEPCQWPRGWRTSDTPLLTGNAYLAALPAQDLARLLPRLRLT